MRQVFRVLCAVVFIFATFVAVGVLAWVASTDCARAASEISDPCAGGRRFWVGSIVWFWLLVGLPAGIAVWAMRPRAETDFSER